MSFLRYWGAIKMMYIRRNGRRHFRHARPHHPDELPVGYSLAGCSPALPASASPTITQSTRFNAYPTNFISGPFLDEATTCISGPFFDEATGVSVESCVALVDIRVLLNVSHLDSNSPYPALVINAKRPEILDLILSSNRVRYGMRIAGLIRLSVVSG